METIKVGFSKPNKFKLFAWSIMVGFNIPYSHVYVRYYSNKYERFVIYQASHSMVNFMSPVIFESDNLVVKEFSIDMTDENRTKMIQFAMDNSGKSYGVKQALGMAIVRICELFGKTIKNPFKDEGSTYVCSELGGYILKNFTDIKVDKDLDDVTPKDLYELLSVLPQK